MNSNTSGKLQRARYSSIIVDTDHKSRMRLRHAMSSVEGFEKVQQLSLLSEALESMKEEGTCDVVFISRNFQGEEVSRFVGRAKESFKGRDAAYVLICQKNDQKGAHISSQILHGIDAFLFEPYSVDSLLEIIELAEKVKRERSVAREIAALEFLMTEIMNQLDLIAHMAVRGKRTTKYLEELTASAAVLRTLKDESIQRYHDIASHMLINAPSPKRIYQRRKYFGASRRVLETLALKKKLPSEVK